ncbi:MAG: protocatechuate 3,4-dioxygenase subunit alpha [Pseudomonadota bacterium]
MRALVKRETPSQTAGPYVHIGLTPRLVGIERPFQEDLGSSAPVRAKGAVVPISLSGTVRDGAGALVSDACLEFWQAGADGRYSSAPAFGTNTPDPQGFARRAVGADTGLYRLETVKPGKVPMGDGRFQAPHIAVIVFARGINIGLLTRCYFDDEPDANAADPVLAAIEPTGRRRTLIASATTAPPSPRAYRFDIVLQGENETVFFRD